MTIYYRTNIEYSKGLGSQYGKYMDEIKTKITGERLSDTWQII